MHIFFIITSLWLLNMTSLTSHFYYQAVDEYILKAIWLEKFTHFIEWPDSVQNNTSSFVIGVYGINNFEGRLEEIYDGKLIKDKRVEIKYYKTLKDFERADILYLFEIPHHEFNAIINKLKYHPVLIVSDVKGYAEMGVHINFYESGNNLKIEINESSLKDSKLVASFRLLSIAKIVNPISIDK